VEQVLGVAIGIVLICLLLSIIASHVREMMTAFTAQRAVTLEAALRKMVGDAVYEKLVGHPLIETISFEPTKLFGRFNLSRLDKPRPNYIASSLFTRVLLISLAEIQNLRTTDVAAIVNSLPDSTLKQRLGALILGIENDAAACVSAVEQWYDGTMERVNGVYKRHTQMWLIVLGMILAVTFNANLFQITQRLWTSKDARDAVTATAQMYSCKDGENCQLPKYQDARDQIQKQLEADLPLGYDWGYVKKYWRAWASPEHQSLKAVVAHWLFNFTGWLLMAIAVSLGAPFWFDMLNKLINLRMSGVKPDKAPPTSGSPEIVAAAAVAVPGPPPADGGAV
jgi:hypothetical protein